MSSVITVISLRLTDIVNSKDSLKGQNMIVIEHEDSSYK